MVKMGDKMDNDEMMMDNTAASKKGKKHKIMDMEDVSECLQEDFMEEVEDCKKYLCMAKVADHAGDEHACHYLMEMAHDEYTHATFIYDFLRMHNISVPDEHKECYNKLCEEMEYLFCD